MAEYESELRELADFVPKLTNSEEYLCSKFEEGLSLEIREKMSVSGSQNYKEVVQLALKAEKLTGERRSRGNFQKKKYSDLSRDSHRRKVKVQTHQKIPLVLGLILSVHLSLSGRHNRLKIGRAHV